MTIRQYLKPWRVPVVVTLAATATGIVAITTIIIAINGGPSQVVDTVEQAYTLLALVISLATLVFATILTVVTMHQLHQSKRRHLIDRLLSTDEHTSRTAHKEAETHTLLNPRELKLYSRYETQTKIEPKKEEQNE